MTQEQMLIQAIRHENLKPPDFPFNAERYGRATHFADRVMTVASHYTDRPGTMFAALTAAAYVANARLIVDEE